MFKLRSLFGALIFTVYVFGSVMAEEIKPNPCPGCFPNETEEFRPHPSCPNPGLGGKYRCYNYCNTVNKRCERICEFVECGKF